MLIKYKLLEQHLQEFFAAPTHSTCESICESLWQCYSEKAPIDDKLVQQSEKNLQPVFDELSLDSSDLLTGIIVQLCTAYQHAAFMEGMRLGFQLRNELL